MQFWITYVSNCVAGRVAALGHRADVEELEVVLGRARDRLDVLDLVGGRILEVETVPDAQVDAVVDVVLIPVEVFVDLVGRRDPSVDLSRLRRCDLGFAGRRSARVDVPANDVTAGQYVKLQVWTNRDH